LLAVAPSKTREHLILTAERLFAENGIDSVSMRQVGAAAGQRNHSAIQYHFGTKEALVEAIWVYRMQAVNQRRLQMLESAGPEPELRTLVEAFVYPLVEQLEEEGSYYVRFLSQVSWRPEASEISLGDEDYTRGLRTVFERVVAQLTVPRSVAHQRIRLFTDQVIHAIADRERRMASKLERWDLPSTPAFAACLVDWVIGGLTAPLSEAARRELEEPSSSARA